MSEQELQERVERLRASSSAAEWRRRAREEEVWETVLGWMLTVAWIAYGLEMLLAV